MTKAAGPALAQISRWVREYDGDIISPDDVKVLSMNDVDDDDVGLVVISLRHSPDAVYLELDADGHWVATFPERAEDHSLPAVDLVSVGLEITAVGHLCEYLQGRVIGRSR